MASILATGSLVDVMVPRDFEVEIHHDRRQTSSSQQSRQIRCNSKEQR